MHNDPFIDVVSQNVNKMRDTALLTQHEDASCLTSCFPRITPFIIYGCPTVGKTTLAQSLRERGIVCFDTDDFIELFQHSRGVSDVWSDWHSLSQSDRRAFERAIGDLTPHFPFWSIVCTNLQIIIPHLAYTRRMCDVRAIFERDKPQDFQRLKDRPWLRDTDEVLKHKLVAQPVVLERDKFIQVDVVLEAFNSFMTANTYSGDLVDIYKSLVKARDICGRQEAQIEKEFYGGADRPNTLLKHQYFNVKYQMNSLQFDIADIYTQLSEKQRSICNEWYRENTKVPSKC